MSTKNHSNKSKSIMTAVVGSTSTLALMTAGVPAVADGLYAGFSGGLFNGESAGTGAADSVDDYELSGFGLGGFVGYKATTASGLTVGMELAATGPVEGDADENASYEYSYDVNYFIDAKLSVGTTVANNISVYGFAGMTFASSNNYWTDYKSGGYNYGVGATYDLDNGMFVGVEAIQRNVDGYGEELEDGRAISNAITLRAGFKF